MNPLDSARRWFRLSRRINGRQLHRDLHVPQDEPIPWMEAECPECPWVCSECGSDLVRALHDGYECVDCGLTF